MGDVVYELSSNVSTFPNADEQQLMDHIVRIDPVEERPARDSCAAQETIGRIAISVMPGELRTSAATPSFSRDQFVEPLIAKRSGAITIDGSISLPLVYDGPFGDGARLPGPGPAWKAPFAHPILVDLGLDTARDLKSAVEYGEPIRIAIIDRDFSMLSKVRDAAPEMGHRIEEVQTIDVQTAARADVTQAAGHGTVMAIVLLQATKNAIIQSYQVGLDTGAAYEFIGATHFALALARACRERADVIVVANNRTTIGCPRHLQRVVREVARTGRDGRGTLIVWSSGDAVQLGARPSVAMPADDPSSQPDCLVVGASGTSGEWARRGDKKTPLSRLGPAIDLTAPSDYFTATVGGVSATADDTSLGAALVAASAVAVLRHAPDLTAAELRELLCRTTVRPRAVDTENPAFEAAMGCNDWDHAMHNFKVGHGEVRPMRATIAAIDPISAALIQADRTERRGKSRFVGTRIAMRWFELVRDSADPLVGEYRATWAPLLARAFLHDFEVRRSALWIARHLIELAIATPPTWLQASHGALVDRVLDLILQAVDHVATNPGAGTHRGALRVFAAKSEGAIVALDTHAVSALLETLVAPS